MRLLVTGRHGQVATALGEACRRADITLVPIGRPEIDLERPEALGAAIAAADPDLVVNAAAWTAVDLAESEPDAAFRINAVAAGALASAAAAIGVPIIQLSTDYVFDGSKASPYTEDDTPAPVTVYGRSKLAGERRVAAAHPDHVILRTAWVYSPFGSNFVRTMLRLAESRDSIAVVDDQIGNPTSAADLADGIIAVARNLLAAPGDASLRGVFHMSAAGDASWADFAEAILAGAARRGGRAAEVRRIPTTQYPTPARRPAQSRLDCGRLASRHGVRLPPWPDALDTCLDRLLSPEG
jgi:dTDP-4-dehydrorhamnose reductase